MRIGVGQDIHPSDFLLKRHSRLGRNELEDEIGRVVMLPTLHGQRGLKIGEGFGGRARVGKAAIAGEEDEVAEEVERLGGRAVNCRDDDACFVGEVLERLKYLVGLR
jgi:hypothetical protein